jgi:hypothetical protein
LAGGRRFAGTATEGKTFGLGSGTMGTPGMIALFLSCIFNLTFLSALFLNQFFQKQTWLSRNEKMAAVHPELPWWFRINPQARYFVIVTNINTGQTCFNGLAQGVKQIADMIGPICQMLGYPVPSASQIYQMRSGRAYCRKNGLCLSDYLKVINLFSSDEMSCGRPMDGALPMGMDLMNTAKPYPQQPT